MTVPSEGELTRQRAIHRAYCNLFAMHQEQERQGETFETVPWLGCLGWKLPSGQEVLRHLVAVRAVVDFDRASGVLTVSAEPHGLKLHLEQD